MIYHPLLTVIIPVFNTANLLKRCLDSLLNQVNKQIEILLIDDCSTDNSLDVIKEYAQKYANIQYIVKTKQSGAGDARNNGLEMITTKYVCFLDSDDWIDSNTYEKVINFLERNNNCDIAMFGIKTEYGSPFSSKFKCRYEYSNIIESRFALTLLCKTMSSDVNISSMLGNKVIRTELLKKNNIKFIHKYFEDVYFSFVTFFYSKNVCFIEDTYLHYFQRQDSIMHSFTQQYIEGLLDVLYDLRIFLNTKECFIEYEKDYYSLFNKSIFSLMNMIFSSTQNDLIQKKHIIYLVELLTNNFDMTELINNLDIKIIKEIFCL